MVVNGSVGLDLEVVAHHPVPGIRDIGKAVHCVKGKGPYFEGGVDLLLPEGDLQGGRNCKIFPLFSGKDPFDIRYTSQKSVNPVKHA